MKVSVDTAGRSGYMAKHVTIHSNDRVTPVLPVTVTITVTARAAVRK